MRRLLAVVLLSLAALGTATLARLPRSSQQVGFACDRQTCQAIDVPAAREDTPFTAGAIDLTGDGIPETIYVGENLRVLQTMSKLAQRSAWHVVDVAWRWRRRG